jgi:hypothetical protein
MNANRCGLPQAQAYRTGRSSKSGGANHCSSDNPCGVNSAARITLPPATRRRQRPICTEIPPVTPLRLLVEVARYPTLPCTRTLDPK